MKLLLVAIGLSSALWSQSGCAAGWSPPETFPLGGVSDSVWAMATFDDGSGPALYLGGSFTVAGGVAANHIAKWNGSAWSAVGSGLNGDVSAMAVHDDGTGPALYVGGSFTIAGSTPAYKIARWSGTSWSAVGTLPGGSQVQWVLALAVHTDATGTKLYAGGSFGAAAWNGLSWAVPGSNVSGSVTKLASCDTGTGPRLYAAGIFTNAGGVAADHIACWDGTAWSNLGGGITTNGTWALTSLVAFDDGGGTQLYAGGAFTAIAGFQGHGFARWNGSAWSAPPFTLPHASTAAYVALLTILEPAGPRLHAAVTYADSSGFAACQVSRLESSGWSPLGAPVGGYIYTLGTVAAAAGSVLCAGGFFGSSHPGGPTGSNVSQWTGSAWAPLGLGLTGPVTAVAAIDTGAGPELYAAGSFLGAGGVPASGIARRSGASWVPLGSGMDAAGAAYGEVKAVARYDAGGGPLLVAGGSFTMAGGVPASNVAAWNGSSWAPLGSGVSGGYVSALASGDLGSGQRLYAAGTFTSAAGVAVNSVAEWNGTSWLPLGAGIALLTPFPIRSLLVHDDGSGPALYATGQGLSAGGLPAVGIVRWNGSAWSNVGAIAIGWALAVHDDGTGPALYASTGNFVSRWTGAAWQFIGTGLTGSTRSLASFDDGSGPALYAGGDGIARWNGVSWSTVAGSLQTVSAYWPAGVPSLAVADDGGGPGLFGACGIVSVGGGYAAGIVKWNAGGAPAIHTQPALQVVDPGTPIAMSVYATGSPSLAYQWRKDGNALPGAHAATLQIAAASAADAGVYDVVVTNPCGSAVSQPAIVFVRPAILSISQPAGPGSLLVTNSAGASGSHYFTAFTFDTANASNPGNGLWLGLHVPFPELLSQFLSQSAPFVGTLDASGSSAFGLPPGWIPASIVGQELFAVTAIYDPAAALVLGGSTVESRILQ